MAQNITTHMINSDDAFRKAFHRIAKAAMPYIADYLSDLLYDAAHAAQLKEDERFYLLVRSYGTNQFAYGDDAIAHCEESVSDGKAVLRIIRGAYDNFDVTVIHVAD